MACPSLRTVLILVVMEDALARKDAEVKNFEKAVLILVVMEDALAHKNYDTGLEYRGVVLILVVMEDALARLQRRKRMVSRN